MDFVDGKVEGEIVRMVAWTAVVSVMIFVLSVLGPGG